MVLEMDGKSGQWNELGRVHSRASDWNGVLLVVQLQCELQELRIEGH